MKGFPDRGARYGALPLVTPAAEGDDILARQLPNRQPPEALAVDIKAAGLEVRCPPVPD